MAAGDAPAIRCACRLGADVHCHAHRWAQLPISDMVCASGHTITLEEYRRIDAERTAA